MKTLIIKVEVPDDVINDQINIFIHPKVNDRFTPHGIDYQVIPRPTDEEIMLYTAENVDYDEVGFPGYNFIKGVKWLRNKLWGTE